MKKLIFREILILSHREKRAKKVKFHPERTLIFGRNDTGKSSLIKSLFITFGATPAKINPRWKELSPISMVKFTVDNIEYTILRDGKMFGVFNMDNKLIKCFDSITKGLAPFLADLLNFKLKLIDKNGESITPTPAFIFLPFYVDQDVSWTANWNAFGGLQQFRKPRDPAILYHIGIRPNEYYDTKAEIGRFEEEIIKLDEEKKVTSNILRNLKEKISGTEFNMDIEEFKEEVKELLVECESLKKIEEKHKDKLVIYHNKKIVIESQMEIAEGALKEAERDYLYAVNSLNHTVECPTCGAGYENSFSERFEIAQDSDRCKELIHELWGELQVVQLEIEKENNFLTKTIVEIEKIENILRSKKGEIVFRDVIENAGRNELKNIFDNKISDLTTSISENANYQKELQGKLRSLENKERKDEIQSLYRVKVSRYLRELEVFSLPESAYSSVTSKINDTGSSLPRALTAYYFSIFETIHKYSTSVYCPLVVDSPNQQAQDPLHIERILEFIKNNQPRNTQLILGLEELYGMDFDCPVIELNEKYHLLQENMFEEVKDEMNLYLDQIFQSRGFLF